ncbi:DUF1294 domain-containing protein [Ruegeria marina]|uniref:Uncharacterized membrane protein YsdA, DUF1294 family n=1 Tax=Ruegeria marina TaxID=639004 RepID=A0A1G6NU78_9RHOB|nr:DUF1294 domain-containing protein [Ruegeria marina]SDC71328.1 Uncharacterized membrane protein YsdA, DUF1294 family [Ruegeria marina]
MWNAVIYLWAINGLMVALFAWDRLATRWNRVRVPEHLLLWLAALGASPAAFLSRWLFRHKTGNRPFGRWLWSVALLQLTAGLVVAGKDLF